MITVLIGHPCVCVRVCVCVCVCMCMFLYMASSHSVRICLEGRGVGGVGKRSALSSIIVTTIEVGGETIIIW